MLNIENAWYVIDSIPTVIIAALLIASGIWLLGLHPKRSDDQDLPPYPHDGTPQ